MLILSRKENQKIRIGNNVVINIISLSDHSVKIGIEADKNVKIYREEVYESIKNQNQQAVDNLIELMPNEIRSTGR